MHTVLQRLAQEPGETAITVDFIDHMAIEWVNTGIENIDKGESVQASRDIGEDTELENMLSQDSAVAPSSALILGSVLSSKIDSLN